MPEPERYRLVVYRRLEKDLASLPRKVQETIRDRIRGLRADPRPPDAIRLQGQQPGEHVHRIRVGAYRVVYDIDDAARVVRVILAGHRRDVYDILDRR